jgi:predicted methyltransferase
MSKTSTSLVLLATVLAACHRVPEKPVFPAPERPVAQIISSRFSDEPLRDRAGEARRIFEIADVRAGMKVADIGAGEGYLAVRLAPLVGADGRVLA